MVNKKLMKLKNSIKKLLKLKNYSIKKCARLIFWKDARNLGLVY